MVLGAGSAGISRVILSCLLNESLECEHGACELHLAGLSCFSSLSLLPSFLSYYPLSLFLYPTFLVILLSTVLLLLHVYSTTSRRVTQQPCLNSSVAHPTSSINAQLPSPPRSAVPISKNEPAKNVASAKPSLDSPTSKHSSLKTVPPSSTTSFPTSDHGTPSPSKSLPRIQFGYLITRLIVTLLRGIGRQSLLLLCLVRIRGWRLVRL